MACNMRIVRRFVLGDKGTASGCSSCTVSLCECITQLTREAGPDLPLMNVRTPVRAARGMAGRRPRSSLRLKRS